jgi:hypothetical protein
MKAAVASVPWRGWLLKQPDWLDRQTAVGLTFAVKTFAASLLALYIAFWAGLDDPRWAFLTVYVVSQPDSGLDLAKSFYRILGTIAGVLVTIALVFGLAQYGELFVAALAIWICFCNIAARAVRNFASYGFQLAGYTVAIVAIPAALEPSGAYPLVVARCTEIALGIICAALVSRLILVRELSPNLVELARTLANRPARPRCRPPTRRCRADRACQGLSRRPSHAWFGVFRERRRACSRPAAAQVDSGLIGALRHGRSSRESSRCFAVVPRKKPIARQRDLLHERAVRRRRPDSICAGACSG